ncbi:hypothetical protein [Parabacteroides sp. PF5-6]|uniref:hypothetical protein n=1 Tax=Parabacteroides sp. PF5-6 TaxID=1742403 RepID=UPI002404EB6A|nr:hypothetical protein [Parabacteroides sp. PF5-6]MDF9829344.1 hypothetical protein [Parabacteroides sp. PF5-6]
MAKHVREGDSIAADHADGDTRDFKWKRLVKHPVVGKIMTLYECDRNSYMQIVKVYSGDTEHLKGCYCDLGDELNADAITIYVDAIPRIKPKIINKSHRHKAQEFKIRNKCFGTIKTPLDTLRKFLSLPALEDQKKLK